MFTIYHSNQLDLLKSLTAQLMMHQPLCSVFDKEIVLVQSQGMAQWLQIQLADELGISANIHYPFPTQFIWDIYRIFIPNLPKANTFNIDYMTWVLLDILPNVINDPKFSSLSDYLKHTQDEQKYFQLANSIAQLFDQYLVYRTDWIITWEKGELVQGLDDAQIWQAVLWRKLVTQICDTENSFAHRASIHLEVIHRLKASKHDESYVNQLPKRIFIFGIVSLPPAYLELFNALSQHIDVHFMFMNPCKQYWGDIVDHSFVNKYFDTNDTLHSFLQETNPLLASWGKLGRDHLALLQNYSDKRDIEAFADYSESFSLLSSLQQSILDMKNGATMNNDAISIQTSQHKQVILAHDDSITFHDCHSEQREVEVLYDYLLSILDNNPSITLNDCVVMVADIDHYAPYIQAVFDNAPKSRHLPYTISDQTLRHIDPIIQGFLLLLELPQSRLEIEYIFDLLEIPVISKRFNLNEDNLKQLQNWIIDSGIRWGLESDIDEPHSWLIGLNRMLLGYVMESQLDSWKDVLPYDGTAGLDAELVGFLSDFIMAIAKWCNILSEKKNIAEWQHVCHELLAEFFVFDFSSEPLLLMIEEQWQQIIKQAIVANCNTKISIVTFKNLIQSKFENNHLSHRFLIGKINFCTMMPMRSVPFKVVCLLGMNDGAYPRTSVSQGFDLITHHGRIGDRSRRNDDRYLFLEALLSAGKKLYISYIGRSIQTNDERYPSILVDELLEYLKQSYVLAGEDTLNIEQSAENLKNHLVYIHTRTPFNVQNYLAISKNRNTTLNLISYADEWLPAAKGQGKPSVFYKCLPTEKIEVIMLDDLKRFYHHPIREQAKKKLGYLIGYTDEHLPNTENFNLNSLQKYDINNQIIDEFMSQKPENEALSDKLYKKMLRSNQLPYGAFGRISYADQKVLIQALINQVNNERRGDFSSFEVNQKIDNIRLIGWVKNIQEDGILQWRTSKLTIKEGISLWIDHLAFCAFSERRENFQNRIYGRDDSKWCFKPLPSDEAILLLSSLVQGYQRGLCQPLFMPLQSSWRWLETVYDTNLQGINDDSAMLYKAKNNFLSRWLGGIGIMPECDDYYFRLYPELTDELMDIAIASTTAYLLPLIQHQDK